MSSSVQPTVSSRRPGSRRRRTPSLVALVTAGVVAAGLQTSPVSALELSPGAAGAGERAAEPGRDAGPARRAASDVGPLGDHSGHEGDEEDAERAAEDRALLLASSWRPDPALLVPREDDSRATAALRAELAGAVTTFRTAVAAHERSLRRAARADRALVEARSDVAAAVLATAAARRQVEEDRAALMALMAETYRNGSAGSLSLMLGGGGDDEEGLFSGLTLLSQMSSSQDDALRAVRRSLRELAAVEEAEEEARDQAASRARAARSTARRSEAERTQLLAEVEGIQDLVRQSALRDEVKRRQAAARAERAALLAEDRGFLEAFVGLSPAASERLMQSAARLAASSRGGVVFPLPAESTWFDNDNWGGDGGLWAAGHTGDDFSAACGTPVLAATRGTVTIRTDQGWSGRWLVVVEGANGVASTWYAHMSELMVEDGDRVRVGQRLGSVGSEGNSTGCHLHFEVHPLGGSIYEDNVDPVAFLRLAGAYPEVERLPDGG